MSIPYTYLIIFKPTGQIYFGCRYGKRADPAQLFNINHKRPYFSSSKMVQHFVKTHGVENFDVFIRKTFKTAERCIEAEYRCLKKLFSTINADMLLNKALTFFRFKYEKGNRTWITNGTKNKLIYPSDSIPEGWFAGFTHSRWKNHQKKQSAPVITIPTKNLSNVYFDKHEGVLFSANRKPKGSVPATYYESKGISALPEHKIRLHTGTRNITWDVRLPIPEDCTIGYVLSEKQLLQLSKRKPSIRRLDTFRFKKLETAEEFKLNINELHKMTGISYAEIRFLTDGDKKTIKGWTIYDEEFQIWRNEIPRGNGNWRTLMLERATPSFESLP